MAACRSREASTILMIYAEALTEAMTRLGKIENTIFLGQAVEYKGTAMTSTLGNVPREKLKEMPVVEEMQMGITLGLAMQGHLPISIYPRWNFLLLATNQIVNHIDKYEEMVGTRPHLIIRTSIGSERPIHPQHQHVGDYTDAFRLMCPKIEIIKLTEPGEIVPAYEQATNSGGPTILVEYGDYYNEK